MLCTFDQSRVDARIQQKREGEGSHRVRVWFTGISSSDRPQ